MPLPLGIMSQQKQNLLWLMIICYASCQITCSEKLIIEVDSTDQCFWDRSSSHPAITQTCLSYDDAENCHIMNVTLNISSQGQCRSYSLNIKQGGNYEIRMNGTVKNIKLWLLPDESNCLLSILDSPEIDNCQAQGGIMSISSRITQTVCQNIDPVDLRDTCRNALYDRRKCKEDEGNKYILSLNKNNDGTCVTCDNRPMFNLTTNVKDKDGYTDPSKASDALKDLKCEMEEMEKNVIKAAIVMGDVIGLLHVQAKNTETKDICYSSDEDMINVINCQSDLKAGFPWSVKIPSEAFDKSRQEHNGCAFVGILLFPNMGNKDETQSYTVLNNEVYGITMGANISNLTNNIDMFFTQSDQIGSASCVSWDGKGELNWTTSTCETEQINSNTIKCSCSHLMFFTVLMAPTDENVTPCLESLTFIIYIGCGIFMFFLFIALFMHFLLWKAKSNQATKILMNMFVALCLLNASFLSNESVANTQDNAACVFIALLLHYSMLASFTWFFIQALHMYLWLIRQNIITNYMRKITVLGWVCPAPIVIVIVSVGGYNAVILNATSGKITQMCWITNPYIHYTVNIGYYALVLIFMTGIFITILTSIVHARHIRSTDGKRKTFRKQLMLVLSLFLLFGLTWSVAFFSYGPTCIPLYYILFTVLNSFQGFFLFLYYYHIHNVVPGHFSDDPESTDYTTTFTQSSINVMENIQN